MIRMIPTTTLKLTGHPDYVVKGLKQQVAELHAENIRLRLQMLGTCGMLLALCGALFACIAR